MDYEKFHSAADYQFDEKFTYDDSRIGSKN